MARKWRRESLDTDNGAEPADADVEPDAPEGDSSFEEAQQLLQAAVAEIRGYEVTVPDDMEDGDEGAAHRRWRRRVHAEGSTGEHQAISTGEHQAISPTETTADKPFEEPALFETALFEPPPVEPALAEASAAAAANRPTDPLAEVDELDEVAAATAARRVPRRRRGGSRPSTISSPTADYVLAMEQPEAAPGGPVEVDTAPDSGRRRRILVASLVAVLVLAGITIAVTTSGSDDEVASPPAKVLPRLTFDPVTTTDGVEVVRVWRLNGTLGSDFTGRLAFTNPTAKAVTTTFTEVIPKSLASSVSDITFDPQPVVVKADPVVEYTVTVNPGETFRATYEITVPAAGRSRARLLTWAEDLQRETGTTTTTLPPVATTAGPPPTTTSGPTAATTPTTPRTTPTTAAPAPPTAAPAPPPTTSPPPPPVVQGSIVVRVVGAAGTYTFTNGTSLTVGEGGSAQTGAMSVDPGLYPWTMTSGNVTNIDCSDRDSGPFENRSTVSIANRSATFNVQPGEFIACTWSVSES